MVASSYFAFFTKHYTVMFDIESILVILKDNFWTIFIRILIVAALYIYLYYYKAKTTEGFEIKNGMIPIDKMYVCPTLKLNLAQNSAVLEEHVKFDRIVSEKTTRDIIEAFTQSYQAHECDEYFADPNNPRVAPRIAPEPLASIEHRLKKEKEERLKSKEEKSEEDMQ